MNGRQWLVSGIQNPSYNLALARLNSLPSIPVHAWGFRDSADSLTLMTGEVAPRSEITFDQNTYHFFWVYDDITDILTRAQKKTFPGFDQTKDNLRLYNENQNKGAVGPSTPLNTSTISILANNLATDPFRAPLNAALGRPLDAPNPQSTAISLTETLVLGLVAIFGMQLLSKV